jgi:glyoxylate reductase
MKKKVFLTRTLHEFALKELKKRYQIEVHSGKIPIPQTKLQTKIKEIDGLICFPYDIINKVTIDLAKNLKVIKIGRAHV